MDNSKIGKVIERERLSPEDYLDFITKNKYDDNIKSVYYELPTIGVFGRNSFGKFIVNYKMPVVKFYEK